ncbi:MAG: GNAT family N-acetyltransferase [Ilumatobacteraceae bacterium]
MIDIRATEPDEFRAASAVASDALLQARHDDETWAKRLESWTESDSVSAWDGDSCVGHASAYAVDTVVPGGARLATAAVTRVGVRSTHRRRGVATGLMERVLDDAKDRGQVLASLRASEATIYTRFGFGVAGEALEVVVDPHAARPITGGAPGTFRVLPPGQILDTLPALYDRIATTPGRISRPAWMWRLYLDDALSDGGEAGFVVVHTDLDGVDDGYVHYATSWASGTGTLPEGKGEVHDLIGATPAVELALWAYLCDVDLVRSWTAEERPVDDLIRFASRDRRAYRVALLWDEQWLRLLDVGSALADRTYTDVVTSGVTIAVRDPLVATNNGVYRVEAKGASRVEAGSEDADLAVDVATLAATYLGGVRWSTLTEIGLVDVRDPRSVEVADALFSTPRAPLCGSFF